MSYNKVKNDYQTDYEIICTIEKGRNYDPYILTGYRVLNELVNG